MIAIQAKTAAAQQRLSAIFTADGRAAAFQAAGRHSRLVRILRLACPAAALAIAGLYFLPSRLSVEIGDMKASIESVDLSADGLKMVNPRIKGVHNKQGTYDMRAESAVQHIRDTNLITLNKIDAGIVSPAGEETQLAAPSGLYDSEKEQLTMNNGVTVQGQSGLSAKLRSAIIQFQQQVVISNEPVEVRLHDSLIRAQSLQLFTAEKRAVFTGKVYVHLERQEQEQEQDKPGQEKAGNR